MSTYTSTRRIAPGTRFLSLKSALQKMGLLKEGGVYAAISVGALVAFEVFNFSTTEFALTDLLGELQFLSIRWSTILALAFSGMDFAGIARLFSPTQDRKQFLGRWYLLGAWALAATMNALLTWWAVSLALLNHQGLGNEILGRESLLGGVPVFVAVLVWLIRVLLIGSFTLAGRQLTRPVLFDRIRSEHSDRQPGRADNGKSVRERSIRPAPKPVPTRNSVRTSEMPQ